MWFSNFRHNTDTELDGEFISGSFFHPQPLTNFKGHWSIRISLKRCKWATGPYEFPLKFIWTNGSQVFLKFWSASASVHRALFSAQRYEGWAFQSWTGLARALPSNIVSGSLFHPQPLSLLILLSEPGSERKVLTKETWFSLVREWKSWKLQREQFLSRQQVLLSKNFHSRPGCRWKFLSKEFWGWGWGSQFDPHN